MGFLKLLLAATNRPFEKFSLAVHPWCTQFGLVYFYLRFISPRLQPLLHPHCAHPRYALRTACRFSCSRTAYKLSAAAPTTAIGFSRRRCPAKTPCSRLHIAQIHLWYSPEQPPAITPKGEHSTPVVYFMLYTSGVQIKLYQWCTLKI